MPKQYGQIFDDRVFAPSKGPSVARQRLDDAVKGKPIARQRKSGKKGRGGGSKNTMSRANDAIGVRALQSTWAGISLASNISLNDGRVRFWLGFRNEAPNSATLCDTSVADRFRIDYRDVDHPTTPNVIVIRISSISYIMQSPIDITSNERFELYLDYDGTSEWTGTINGAPLGSRSQALAASSDLATIGGNGAASDAVIYHFQVRTATVLARFHIDEGTGSTTTSEADDTPIASRTGTISGTEGVAWEWVTS